VYGRSARDVILEYIGRSAQYNGTSVDYRSEKRVPVTGLKYFQLIE